MEEFIKIMERLLGEDGCPWDRVQTHESIRNNFIEECYEVADAIDNRDFDGLCEELGDVLMHIVFHSILAEKEGYFTFDDVVEGVSRKMVSRHPHVFGNAEADSADEVLTSWEEIKKKEKGYRDTEDVLRRVPKALPALMRAEKLVSKAKKYGDFVTDPNKTINRIKEQIDKIDDEKCLNTDREEIIGNILMNLAELSNFFEINPEFALTNASEKFITMIRRD